MVCDTTGGMDSMDTDGNSDDGGGYNHKKGMVIIQYFLIDK